MSDLNKEKKLGERRTSGRGVATGGGAAVGTVGMGAGTGMGMFAGGFDGIVFPPWSSSRRLWTSSGSSSYIGLGSIGMRSIGVPCSELMVPGKNVHL
jgi:hypothetical protein